MELETRQKRHSEEHLRLRAYGWLFAVCAAAAVIAFLFTAVFVAVQATDGGMAPFIERGDVVLYFKLSRLVKAPSRGDAVLFETADNTLAMGRVVGLPGEEITMAGGRVYIKGILLDESEYAVGESPDMESITTGEGEYFVLPDERSLVKPGSNPIISGKAIRGTAFLRVSPINKLALFK